MVRFLFITDALASVLASNRPPYAWGTALVGLGHSVTVHTPRIRDPGVARYFTDAGIEVVEGLWLFRKPAMDGYVVVNFSYQQSVPADIFYFQGFLAKAARGVLTPLWPLLRLYDSRWAGALSSSRVVIANSLSSARQLGEAGLRAVGVVYPPIEDWLVDKLLGVETRPEYCLLYIGKETPLTWLRTVVKSIRCDWRAFGKRILPNAVYRWMGIELIPRFPEEDLPKVLSGARVLVFLYGNHTEPFGYVPVEGVLAGVPTVSVGSPTEGPHEQVAHLKYPVTWLPNPRPLIEKGLDIARKPTWEERVRVAENHRPRTGAFVLLKFTNTVLNLP